MVALKDAINVVFKYVSIFTPENTVAKADKNIAGIINRFNAKSHECFDSM
uniref:Uncharacterized protein n=1 Tax=viral metagenome TaxID=1070528 RepID=A0A6C0EI63_9ZZZZ